MFLRSVHFTVLLAIICLFLPACNDSSSSSGQTDYSATRAAMIPIIDQAMADNEVVGLAVALVDGDRLVWSQGFGYADAADQVPATDQTLFEIGSVSKTLTAMAVMRQVEAGKLDLDAPLETVLPQFAIGAPLGSYPVPAGTITVRSMLTHHTGIPGDLFNGGFSLTQIPDYNERMIEYLRGNYAEFPVNFVWSYSNTATSLLANVIEEVSGRSFEAETQAMFNAMGMLDTTFYPEPLDLPGRSLGYFDGAPVPFFYVNIPAAGSVVSNVDDMSRYMRTVLGGGTAPDGARIIGSRTLATMLTPQNSGVALDQHGLSIGLIWVLTDPTLAYAGKLCWHNGATMVFRSHLELLLDHGLGVFVVANSNTADSVVASVARETLKRALTEKTGISPQDTVLPASPFVAWDRAALEALAGIYVTDAGYDQIEASGEGLLWTPHAGPGFDDSPGTTVAPLDEGEPAAGNARAGETVLLRPRADGLFSAEETANVAYEFSTVSGRMVIMSHTPGLRFLMAERFEPPATVPAAWLARLGRWTPADLDPDDAMNHLPGGAQMDFILRQENGLLVCVGESDSKIVLEPVSDTVCHVRGLKRGQGGALHALTDNSGQELLDHLFVSYEKVDTVE
jgi:CubicO group peptidase (beta-lactamase class C family)